MTVSQAPGGPAAAIRPGGLFSRFLSCMVDSVIPVLAITGCWLALARLQPGSRLSLVAIMLTALVVLGWGVYVWWCGAERAATPGMRLLELEVVDLKTGGHVGWGRFFARCFVFGLLSATGIGLILMLIFLVLDSHQRGWHDRAAGAIVINRPEVARDEHGDPTGGAEVRGPRTNTVALPAHLTGATSFKPTGTAGLGIQQPGTPQQPPPHQPAPMQPPPPAHQPPQQPRQPIQQVPGSRPPQFGETPWGDHRPAGQSGWQPPQMLPEQPPTGTADPDADADADKTVLRPKGSGPAPAPTASWSVTLADGRAYQLRPAVLIGRNPDPQEGQQAELVTMNDETRTVSKNHLLIGVDEQGPFVVDLGSRNGSGIRAAHGGFNRIPVGEKVRLGPGAVVSFGEQRLELHAG
ncbi:hypothetical protein CGZ94_01990 [Enemella evansiae]|uniref:FHA domain-containing protein n=1 Tax=Enemella evansiae TaxID=2016499 RepID=A0A255GQ24_9ACTN|nr:RDD family protein [Enemella evansiae]OYO17681.1 hypothetical protein CGZ94_01990 [Enemella evansiae]